ncbi:hypothetical protein IQ238_20495 [Pleurocapsales cyanobacterium LEGE 06147]|nr:hypothetical protein [Pleurocapsales cyanobacterium LEGE 06147]
MNSNTSFEEQNHPLAAGKLSTFAEEHKQELETVTKILAEITNCTPAQVESRLETLLSELIDGEKKQTPSQKRVEAFQEWVDSHKGMNFPAFVDDSRESIYGDKD